MFSGLIEGVGKVSSIRKTGSGFLMSVTPDFDMEPKVGDSIAVNGICLTVINADKGISFEVSPETVKSTNFAELKVNDRVNLERALRFSDRLGGHLVTGHVDGVGVVRDKKDAGEFTFYIFEAPGEILRYVVKKGSIAIDGISLTVTEVDEKSFSVAVIPHTLAVTNIGDKGVGDKVNIEVDIIGKYVEKFMSNITNNKSNDQRLLGLLKERGFTE